MATPKTRFGKIWSKAGAVLSVAAIGFVLFPIFLADNPWPVEARDYLAAMGQAETGAVNLVSSIYLGYRIFDTLGETIVLLVAVLGTMSILSRVESLVDDSPADDAGKSGADKAGDALKKSGGFSLSREKRHSHTLRTDLLEAVTGKIGPVILIFGFYVMLFGHVSPGGGFQGGVIVASAIVFLTLGNPGAGTLLSNTRVLSTLETAAFLLMLLLSSSGLLFGQGFFGNPMAGRDNPEVYIIILNAVVGLKVGASLGFLCITMMGGHK
ncbi:MAG: MnhB domain-containing protein [Spirochaetales bacterium]|nr:MnhB domain-containing protein [Spirochaetales bacterium]